MTAQGDLMKKSIKKILIPALNQLGFEGKGLHYRRKVPSTLDLLSIQHWKYGGEFILEFGSLPRGDLQTSWGELVPEDKLDVAYVDPLMRARLIASPGRQGENLRGFAFAGFGNENEPYIALASEVATLLPQVDEWLGSKVVGSNVSPFSR